MHAYIYYEIFLTGVFHFGCLWHWRSYTRCSSPKLTSYMSLILTLCQQKSTYSQRAVYSFAQMYELYMYQPHTGCWWFVVVVDKNMPLPTLPPPPPSHSPAPWTLCRPRLFARIENWRRWWWRWWEGGMEVPSNGSVDERFTRLISLQSTQKFFSGDICRDTGEIIKMLREYGSVCIRIHFSPFDFLQVSPDTHLMWAKSHSSICDYFQYFPILIRICYQHSASHAPRIQRHTRTPLSL